MDFGMSIVTMLIGIIQHGQSRTSPTFLTKTILLIEQTDRQTDKETVRKTEIPKKVYLAESWTSTCP